MIIVGLLFLSGNVCFSTVHKGKPIPAGPDAYTARKYMEEKTKWLKKMLVNNYNRYGTKNKKWNDKARSFLTEIVEFFQGNRDEELIAKLKSASLELMNLGCTDPYIVYCHGNLLHHFEGAGKAEVFVRQALGMLEKSKYPPIYRYYAANRLAYICEKLQRGNEAVNDMIDRKLKYFATATADKAYKNGHQRFLIEDFYNMWNDLSFPHREILFNYLNEVPESDPWIAAVIRGNFHIKKGWKLRGSGWAYKVSEEGWEGFREALAKAREELTKAYELHPEYPEAAADMITVRMGSQGPVSLRGWFDRAVAAQMDYIPAYHNLLWALRPRWHGSHKDMYEFGVECLNTKRFDTEVARKFLKVVWDIGSDLDDWTDAYRRPGVYEHMQEFFDGILNEPTKKDSRNYYKTVYAVTAWAARRYDDAKKLFDELGDKVDTSVFKEFNTKAEWVIGEVNALTGPFKDQIRLAEELFSENQSPEGLIIFEKAYEKSKNDPMASAYLQSRIVTLRAKKELLKDEWTTLMPGKNLAGWEVKAGKWVIENDGTLKGTSTNEGLMLLCNTYIDGNFEIKGEIDARFNAALLLGYSETITRRWASFRIYENYNQCGLGRRFSSNRIMRNIQLKKQNQFHVQVWGSCVTAYINGQPVFTAQEVDRDWWSRDKGRIGCGGYYKDYPGHVVKVRNLKIRRLKTKPKGFDGTSGSGA